MRAPLLGALKVMKGISLHGGSDGQTGVGSSTRHYERWLQGALELETLSLCGSSVKGTCREGSHAGDPEGYVEKALQTGISFHKGPIGEPGRGLTYWVFERWMKGALWMEHLSLKKFSGESLKGRLLY